MLEEYIAAYQRGVEGTSNASDAAKNRQGEGDGAPGCELATQFSVHSDSLEPLVIAIDIVSRQRFVHTVGWGNLDTGRHGPHEASGGRSREPLSLRREFIYEDQSVLCVQNP